MRPIPLITPLNWGTGTVVRVSIEFRVENDCVITAPDLDFGSAPSMSADSGSSVYDSVSSQAYTYRAEVLPGPTPPQGSYGDTIRIDVDF